MKRNITKLLIAASVLSLGLTGCGKTVVVDENSVIESQKATESTSASETVVTTEAETTVEETTEARPENAGEMPDSIEVKTDKTTETVSVEIEDEAKANEIIQNIRNKMNETKKSYSIKSSLDFEFIDLNKSDYSSKRYFATVQRERMQDAKNYYSHVLNDSTYIGDNTIIDSKTYLIDNGEKTLSYSKKFDTKKEVEDKVEWLGALVNRDLETEVLNFNSIESLLDTSTNVVSEENYNGTDCYTLTCFYPLYQALELIGVNPEFAGVAADDSVDYKATIKLYVNRADYELMRYEVSCKTALEKYYTNLYDNNEAATSKMQLQKCKAYADVGDFAGIKIELPEEIQKRLPDDVKKAMDNELGLSEGVDDKNSITLDGDFAIGISKSNENSADTVEETSESTEAESVE